MTQEDKELLLKDLCARIPNHVKVELHGEICTCLGYFDDFVMLTSNTPLGQQTNIANIKPYLRPMSSMTEEESKEFDVITNGERGFYEDENGWIRCDNVHTKWGVWPKGCAEMLDWLNKHHFDYRGLIEKGLSIEAPEGMYEV